MFRFTIRELVLLTLVVAMGVAWSADHRQLQIQNSQFLEEQLKAIDQLYELEIRLGTLAEVNQLLLRRAQMLDDQPPSPLP